MPVTYITVRAASSERSRPPRRRRSGTWHADHVYKHVPGTILVFWLFCMIAVHLFHAFFTFNLKPSLRARTTMLMAGRLVLAELLASLSTGHSHPP